MSLRGLQRWKLARLAMRSILLIPIVFASLLLSSQGPEVSNDEEKPSVDPPTLKHPQMLTRRTVTMKNRGKMSPGEVVAFLEWEADSLDKMDFSQADATTIFSIMKHLSPEKRTLLADKLKKDNKNSLRHSTDGTYGVTYPPPRQTCASQVAVDESWVEVKARQPHSSVSPMTFGTEFGPQWNTAMAFFDRNDGRPRRTARDLPIETLSDEDLPTSEEDSYEEDWTLGKLKDQDEKIRLDGVKDLKDKKSVQSIDLREYFDDSSDSADDDKLRAFFPGHTSSPTTSSAGIWQPPSQPRRTANQRHPSEPIDMLKYGRRISSDELMMTGFKHVGKDRFISPTRNKPADRKRISRETSFGSGRLSRDALIRSASSTITSEHYRGITNGDNLCYVSAVLQALFHLPGVPEQVSSLDHDCVKEGKRKALSAIRRVFDKLGRCIDLPSKELRLLTPITLTADDVELIAGGTHHGQQGDASEAFQRLLSLAGFVLKVNETALSCLFKNFSLFS